MPEATAKENKNQILAGFTLEGLRWYGRRSYMDTMSRARRAKAVRIC